MMIDPIERLAALVDALRRCNAEFCADSGETETTDDELEKAVEGAEAALLELALTDDVSVAGEINRLRTGLRMIAEGTLVPDAFPDTWAERTEAERLHMCALLIARSTLEACGKPEEPAASKPLTRRQLARIMERDREVVNFDGESPTSLAFQDRRALLNEVRRLKEEVRALTVTGGALIRKIIAAGV